MRSLEEIDFIFAKGFTEKKSYVMAGKELPMMAGDASAIEKMMVQYGFAEPTRRDLSVAGSSTVGTSSEETKLE